MRRTQIILALLAAASAPLAHASATLHIGSGYGTTCDTGGCPLYSGEVNGMGPGLDIYQNSGGAGALIDPVLLILGVPNTGASNLLDGSALNSAYVIDGGTGTQTAISWTFGTSSFGLDGNGYEGLMTSGDVYGFLSLDGNNSNSFGNWSTWDAQINGITADNFGIYVFGLDPGATDVTDFAGKDFLDLTLSGVPQGTFAVAYGVDDAGKSYSTPFTEAGLTTTTPPSVPEPMTLALMGTGLLGMGLVRRGRKS